MNKFISNEKGLTLIELLVSLVLTITLSIFAFNLLTKGLEHYENIKTTNELRDEADYIMAQLLKEIYTTKESEITFHPNPDQNKNYFMVNKSGKIYKNGFENQKLIIQNKEIPSQHNNVSISNKSYINKQDDGKDAVEIYNVRLVLVDLKKNKEVHFDNEVRTINDKEIN